MSVGVPAVQAEAHAKALGDVLGKSVGFSSDLVALENALTLKLNAVETRLETKIDSTRTELKLELGGKIETLKWMFGVLVALNIGILVRLLYIH